MYDTGIQAIRFGELPGNGRSINFLASEFDDGGELTSAVYEAGVSVFRMKDGRADIEIETFRQLRSALNRLRGEAYIAEGEELPQKGADGEPLLADAKIVRPLTAEEMAGIKEQLHGVLRMNYWSETESGVKNRIASGPSFPLPEKWLSEKPEGASFVHPGLFLANFDTEKHAMDAARGILREKIRGIGEDR